MTTLQAAVLHIVRLVPPSKVASYGQVAAYLGTPRAARQVGWAMHSLGEYPNFPGGANSVMAGTFTIKGHLHSSAQLQKELFEAGGVVVDDNFNIDMTRYRYHPDAAMSPDYIKSVLAR